MSDGGSKGSFSGLVKGLYWNIMEYKDPGKYIPIIYLLYSWGSRFGVPSRVPLFRVYGLGCACFVLLVTPGIVKDSIR